MRWAVFFAIAAMMLAAVNIMAPSVDSTQLIADLGSASTSAFGQSREFCLRTIMNILFDYPLIDRVRVLAFEQFDTFYHAAKEVLAPYIDVCHTFVANAMGESSFFCSEKGPRQPQTEIESVTYYPPHGFEQYPQYGTPSGNPLWIWGIPPSDLCPRPAPGTSTLVFVVVSNLCTFLCTFLGTVVWTGVLRISIRFATSISSAILAALGLVWRSATGLVRVRLAALRLVWTRTKGLVRVRFPARPKIDWETILGNFFHSLARLAAGGFNMLVVCLASLIFCIVNTIVWAANLDIGFKLARLEIPPAQVIYRTLEDPRVPKLQEDNRWLHNELADKIALLENTRDRYDTDIRQRDRENRQLDDSVMAQKAVILGQNKMLASIDMTRSIYDQLKEKDKLADNLRKEKDLAVEEKKQSELSYSKQLGDQFETMRTVRRELRVEKQEHALLQKEHACCQGRVDSSEAMSRLLEASRTKRIQDLEKSLVSKEETSSALLKEHEELIASQKASINSFEEQLKERDEIINTLQKAYQGLEARMKEQEDRHASQMKSEAKNAEAELDAETQAHEAAKQELKAEQDARKAAEEKLEAEKEARQAARQQSVADSEALKEAKAEATKKEEQIKQEKDAHASTKSKLKAENMARMSASKEVAQLTQRLFAGSPSSNAVGTRASNPSPEPETLPTAPSLPDLSRGEDTSDESSSDLFGDDPEPSEEPEPSKPNSA